MTWTIGKKLGVSFALLCLVTGVMGVMLIKESLLVREDAERLTEILDIRAKLSRCNIEHLNWVTALEDLLIMGGEFEEELDPTKCEFGNWYYSFNPEKIEGLIESFRAIEKPHGELHESALWIKNLHSQGKIEEGKRVYTEVSRPAMNNIQSNIYHIRYQILDPQIEALEYEIAHTQSRQMVLVFSTFIVGILLAVGVWMVLVRKIVNPITSLTGIISGMTRKGDFSNIVEVKSKDEIGTLSESFNAMTNKINQLISQIEENALTLALDLSEQFEVLQRMNKGDFSQAAPEDSQNELVAKLGGLINQILAQLRASSGEIEENAMTLALDLSEQFEVLQRMNKGDFSQAAPEDSQNELVAKLGGLINQILGRFRASAKELESTIEELQETQHNLNRQIKEASQARAELDQIFQTAADGMRVVDRDFNIFRVNNTFVTLSGVSRDEALSKKCYEVFPGPLCHTPECTLKKILAGEQYIEREMVKQRPDGSDMWCILVAMPFKNSEGEVIGIVEDFKDITDRKQMEEEIEENAMTLALDLSEQFEVLQRMNKGDFSTPAPEDSQNELVAKLGGLINQILAQLRASSREIEENAMTLALDLSEQFEVLQRMNKGDFSQAAPEDSQNELVAKLGGLINYILGRFRASAKELKSTIEELQKTQHQLDGKINEVSHTRDELDQIFQTAANGMRVVDRDFNIFRVNNRFVTLSDVSRDESLGKKCYEVFPGPLCHTPECTLKKILAGEQYIEREMVKHRPDGSDMWVRLIATPFKNPDGEVIGMVEDFRDVTDRRRAREEREQLLAKLEAKNVEMEHFVYTVSHDLKSPLVSLEGLSGALLEDCGDKIDDQGRHYLHRIEANVQKMERLIQDLLELSRIGRIESLKEEVDTGSLVQDILEDLDKLIREKGIEMQVRGDFPSIYFERNRLYEVFSNLIINACNFINNSKPYVEIGAQEEKEEWLFWVKDNGIGIEPDYQDKIFEIFQRLGEIDVKGTGVGLTIVKRIVETQGGRIWVKSQKGEGSTFYFTLPKGQMEGGGL